MVCDDDFTTFSRAWCLYEAMRALQLGLPLDLTTPAGCVTQSAGHLGLRNTFQKLGQKLLEIDVAKAETLRRTYRAMILQEIQLVVGHEQLNLYLRSFFGEKLRKLVERPEQEGVCVNARVSFQLEIARYEARRVSWHGRTALHSKVQSCDKTELQLHLRHMGLAAEGDLNEVDDQGRTPLHYAMRFNPHANDVVEVLLNARAEVATDEHYVQPLHWAAAAGQIDAVQMLSSLDSIAAKDDMGLTPLHWAAMHGQTTTLKFLIDQRASINVPAQGALGRTPLLLAAAAGEEEVVIKLLDHQAKLTTAKNGVSLLHEAAKHGAANVLKRSLQSFSPEDLNRATPEGLLPALHLLCMYGAGASEEGGPNRLEALRLLLEHRADLEARDSQGRTPLHRAASAGASELLELLCAQLLERNCSLDPVATDGTTPLHAAARRNHQSVVSCLIQRRAEVNKQNKEDRSRTALHMAAEVKAYEAAKTLLNHGADHALQDTNQTDAQAVAKEAGYDLLALIQ
ncbi:unnamed protein product [Durusdinium trenchii]|uniref:Ankyrin-3 (ANK-3) (Ankyrin-G) n=2 Tax=Durusdinium trenchii TaxID=1381693 RepID=A0ABP0SQZ9_9DINO